MLRTSLAMAFVAALPAPARAQPAGYHQVYAEIPTSASDISNGAAPTAGSHWFINVEQCCSGSQYSLTAYDSVPPNETAATYPFTFDSVLFMDTLQFHNADAMAKARYFTTGIITSAPTDHTLGHSWKYGYFEWSAQVPPDTVTGTWPGLYFKSTDQTNHDFELDVMEHYGAFPNAYSATMTNRQVHPNVSSFCDMNVLPAGQDLATARHKYGMLWTATQITFYFDGKAVCGPFSATAAAFNNPAYAIMSLGEGGANGRNDPSQLPARSVFQIRSFTVWQP